MEYIAHILVMASIFATIAVSLNLTAGHTGLLSVCQAAFFAVGAYSTAILTTAHGWPWETSVCAGVCLAIAVSVLAGLISLRLGPQTFVLATFALQMIVFHILQNWSDVTGGALGISGVPLASAVGLRARPGLPALSLAVGVAVFATVCVSHIARTPYGRVLRSIREDEAFTQSAGKNTFGFKLNVFVLSAIFASVSGSIYASYMGFVDPSSFTIHDSIFMLALVIIGGTGSTRGAVLGAVVLVGFPEALRFLGMPLSIAANVRQLLYGLLLVGCMLWRPQGLWGKYPICN
jgi:branched-chain amino acid transport system permease protein